MAKISIIVPVYKVEPYIHRCVDSILAQTFTDFELILVDDGSPDNCPAILDEFAATDERIKVIHKINGGVSSARNAGLDIAAGEYVTFVDSDDEVTKNYLEHLFRPQFDLVVTSYEERDNGKTTHVIRHKYETNHILVNSKTQYQHVRDNIHGCCGKLFRHKIIQENRIRFDEQCSFGEDSLFSAAYFRNCKSFCILDSEDYIYYHDNEYSLSSVLKCITPESLSYHRFGEEYINHMLLEVFKIDGSEQMEQYIGKHFVYYYMSTIISPKKLREKKALFSFFYSDSYFLKALDNRLFDFRDVSDRMYKLYKCKSSNLMCLFLVVNSAKTKLRGVFSCQK